MFILQSIKLSNIWQHGYNNESAKDCNTKQSFYVHSTIWGIVVESFSLKSSQIFLGSRARGEIVHFMFFF
jgi:hypothetical protein